MYSKTMETTLTTNENKLLACNVNSSISYSILFAYQSLVDFLYYLILKYIALREFLQKSFSKVLASLLQSLLSSYYISLSSKTFLLLSMSFLKSSSFANILLIIFLKTGNIENKSLKSLPKLWVQRMAIYINRPWKRSFLLKKWRRKFSIH